jgi:hypothetical protein
MQTIDAFRENNDGENPTQYSGLIEHGPLANGVRTWQNLDSNLRYGQYSLLEDPKWHELNTEMQKQGKTPSLAQLLQRNGYNEQLTIDLIVRTIDAFRDNNNGQNPTAESGLIEHGPLANGTRTWMIINNNIRAGAYGLSDDPEWQQFNHLVQKSATMPSLPLFLQFKGYNEQLTVDLVMKTVNAFRANNNGRNPSNKSGVIEDGPLANGARTWLAIDQALKTGIRGLSKDPEWQKLKEHAEKQKQPCSLFLLLQVKGYAQPLTKNITIKKIMLSIDAFRAKNNGASPSQYSGIIEEAPLANGSRTWMVMNTALRVGGSGLSDDPEWQRLSAKYGGKLSLSRLIAEYDQMRAEQAQGNNHVPPPPELSF